MNLPSWFSSAYSAVLHVSAVAALTVLIAVGKVSWSEGGPILAALLGFAAGVPVSPTPPSNPPTP